MSRRIVWKWISFVIGFLLLGGMTACETALTNPSSTPSTNLSSQKAVVVTLTDAHLQSSLTTFTMDTPYHFVITNKGQTAREFMIMPPKDTKNMSIGQIEKIAMAKSASIQPGKTQVVDFSFTHDNVMSNTSSMDMSGFALAYYLSGNVQEGTKLSISLQM